MKPAGPDAKRAPAHAAKEATGSVDGPRLHSSLQRRLPGETLASLSFLAAIRELLFSLLLLIDVTTSAQVTELSRRRHT